MGAPLTNILAEQGNDVYVTSRKQHISESSNIHFLLGNAKENDFLSEITRSIRYDAIVDFMHYRIDEFYKRADILLSSTDHYMFLSSCRVFAPSDKPLNEDSARLLDVVKDEEYLKTDEYALSKARVEDYLNNSEYSNYTIIRPYITYNAERLQLGMFEKEAWLYRAIHGRSIVFSKDLASKKTTLTYGYDVANTIAELIIKHTALRESINIVSDEYMTWGDVLELYRNTLEKWCKVRPNVIMLKNANKLGKVIGNTYKLKYDRLSDRVFNNEKLQKLDASSIEYTKMCDGLEGCLDACLRNGNDFKSINWKLEAYLDKIAKERTPLKEIPSYKQRIKYLIWRNTPYLSLQIKRQKEAFW